MRGFTAAILGFLGLMLLKARDRLQPAPASLTETDARARERFRAAVQAIRQANEANTEEEIARDVEHAIHEVREARRAASRG